MVKDDAPYYVWERLDGYISCTRYDPGKDCEVIAKTTTWLKALKAMSRHKAARNKEILTRLIDINERVTNDIMSVTEDELQLLNSYIKWQTTWLEGQ